MKIKNLLLLMLAIALNSCSSDSETTNIESVSNSEFLSKVDSKWPSSGSVSVHWEIGRKSRDCDGFGICRYVKTVVTINPISVDLGQLRQTNTFYGNAHKLDENQMLVILDPTSREYINEYFGSNNLIFEEDTEFDFSDLGIGFDNFIVKANTIPILYDEETKQYGFILVNNK